MVASQTGGKAEWRARSDEDRVQLEAHKIRQLEAAGKLVQGLNLNQRPSVCEPRDPAVLSNDLPRKSTLLGPESSDVFICPSQFRSVQRLGVTFTRGIRPFDSTHARFLSRPHSTASKRGLIYMPLRLQTKPVGFRRRCMRMTRR